MPPWAKQTVEVFLTGIKFILFYCSDSIIELSTAKSTDYVYIYIYIYIVNYRHVYQKFAIYFEADFIDWFVMKTQKKHSRNVSNFFPNDAPYL